MINKIFNGFDFKIIRIDEIKCIENLTYPSFKFRDKRDFENEYDCFIKEIINEFNSVKLHKYRGQIKDAVINYYIDRVGVEIVMESDPVLINITSYGEGFEYINYLANMMTLLSRYGNIFYRILKPREYEVEITTEYGRDEERKLVDVILTLKYS